MPKVSLQKLIASACARFEKASKIWSVCYGPGAAFDEATCRRLNWTVVDATTIKTDEGRVLQLTLGSPAAVAIHVKQAVRRWRWRNIENFLPQLTN